MGNSMLLIVAINLLAFRHCIGVQVNLDHDGGSILKSQLMDTNCADEKDCEQFRAGDIKQVACDDKKTCICKDEKDNVMACMPNDQKLANEIGMDCPCLIKHSICKNNKCECKANFTATEDNKHCVPVTSQLDEICEIDLNCQRAEPFSTCLDTKICECDQGFTKENGTCYSILDKVDITCEGHQTCHNNTANSVCAAKHCVCKQGFVASRNENKCLPVMNFEESCEEHLQCKYRLGEGGQCSHGKCSCKPGYRESYVESGSSQAVCTREITVGIDCTTPVDCVLEHEDDPHKSSMVCSNNSCICRSGFSLVDEKFCKEGDAVGAATQNGIISHYFVLLFATIFFYF
ncbi:tenascin [Culicoides brevitarsis]|uniref:tenascin n=1 Tax=Culicoides brevitarsis TaxID=469753 RepID=UPI00307CA570